MNKIIFPQEICQLAKWYEKGILRFDQYNQGPRKWNLLQKSLLVHSILADYPIPALCLVKKNGGTAYQTLDGKQRCTAIFEYIKGEYGLHASTPSVFIGGNEIELANQTFDAMSEECKKLIMGFRFVIYVIEDAIDEEMEEMSARLNVNVPLPLIQKARTEMGTELEKWTREITQLSFFQHAIPFSLAQARHESEMEVLLKSMLLMDAKDRGYEYKELSMREVIKYCRNIRGNYVKERRKEIQCIVEYMSDVFKERHKFLKKVNIPIVFIMADIAMQNDIAPSDFKSFIDSFAGSVCAAYDKNTGSGNINKVETEGRLIAMFQEFIKYFRM